MEQNPVVAVDASTEPDAPPPDVSPETAKIVNALLTAPTLAAAAAALKVSPTTLWRHLKTPGVQREYADACRALVLQAISQLHDSTGEAAQVLRDIIRDAAAPVWARICAARAVLELAFKGLNLADFDLRLAALEAKQKESTKEKGSKND